MHASWKRVLLILGLVAASGCTTASKIYGKQGEEALLIECGAAVSFSVCHDRALKECRNGYVTISETSGFNRKELRVRCK